MKPKLLLAGHNITIIDDFFSVMGDEFECMTTSNRIADITNHIEYFQPDVLVYCFASETKDEMLKLSVELDKGEHKQQSIILIGYPEICDEFTRLNQERVKLVLHRPISAFTIKGRLIQYFGQLEEKVQAMEAKREALKREELKREELKREALKRETLKREEEKREEVKVEEVKVEEIKSEATVTATEPEKKRILVIDDDALMLNLINTELKGQYNVSTAINGKIGIKFLERKKVDLILLDYEMPGEDGAEVFAKLRNNPQTANIPVVFLTGIKESEKIRKVLAMKPQGYLLKPIECEQLVKSIQQIIG